MNTHEIFFTEDGEGVIKELERDLALLKKNYQIAKESGAVAFTIFGSIEGVI